MDALDCSEVREEAGTGKAGGKEEPGWQGPAQRMRCPRSQAKKVFPEGRRDHVRG